MNATHGLEDQPWQIASNVREGIKTKEELWRCGCKNCRAALEILERDELEKEGSQRLNELENIIARNDDGQLDVNHLRKVAAAIVEADERIDWGKLKCSG